MARTKTVQSFRGDTLGLEARIINAIHKVGPKNISLLSRMTGAHAETIRYKVKKQFKSSGFKIDANVDYEKLGLEQHLAELRFSKGYRAAAGKVLSVLNEVAYLTYYAKVVPQGSYLCVFSVPAGASSELRALLEELQGMGLLDGFDLSRAESSRHDSILPAYFNFRSGRWDVDWSRLRLGPARPLPVRKEQTPSDLDAYDLMLMKELQTDALQHVVGIARKLKVHQKTLEYHYRAHVQKRKLISSYYFRWIGKPKAESSSVLLTVLLFRDLGNDFQRVQRAVSKIPFLWSEYVTKDDRYVALLLTPVREAVTLFSYINEEAPELHDRVQVGYVSAGETVSFPVPAHMYKRGWAFDAATAKARLARLVKKTRQ